MIAIGSCFSACCATGSSRNIGWKSEILVLRHQLNVLQRHMLRRRLQLRWADRALFIWLYRRYPHILDVVTIVRPETVVRWHRKGSAAYGGGNPVRRQVVLRRRQTDSELWAKPSTDADNVDDGECALQYEQAHFTLSLSMANS